MKVLRSQKVRANKCSLGCGPRVVQDVVVEDVMVRDTRSRDVAACWPLWTLLQWTYL